MNNYIQNYKPTFIIIGLGISGLATARHCIHNHYNLIILEKNDKLGGCWYNKTYPDVQLQTTKHCYAFSDFPYSSNVSLYPTGKEVLEYLNDYANHHNILQYAKFNSKVINTKFNYDNNKWFIEYIQNNEKYNIYGDYLLICSGFYTDELKLDSLSINDIHNNKKILTIKNFNNKNMDYTQFKNKNICVIGNGPTGCDLACLLHKHQPKNIKLLYRSERWLFRRYLWKKISTDKMLCRFIIETANKTPKFLCIISMIICYYVFYIFGQGHLTLKIKPPFKPVTRQNLVLNENIIEYINKNYIDYIQSNNIKINKDTINFNNKTVEYDYCIICTGYKNNIDFMNMQNIPTLYNHIIHPEIPNCGFIGFAASFNWVQVSELQIQWYLEYLKQNIKHVSKDNMIQTINYKNKHLSPLSYDYHDLSTKAYEYCDNIAIDIKNKLKYSIINPNYWIRSPEHDLWYYGR